MPRKLTWEEWQLLGLLPFAWRRYDAQPYTPVFLTTSMPGGWEVWWTADRSPNVVVGDVMAWMLPADEARLILTKILLLING